MEKHCQHCRHYRGYSPELLADLNLSDMLHMDGECLLRKWEVTADYTCEEFAVILAEPEA